MIVVLLRRIGCGRCVVAETNTASTQSVTVAPLAASVQLVVITRRYNCLVVFLSLFLLEDGIVRLGICFFGGADALLRSDRPLVAVALPDHVLLAGSKLKQVLLIVFRFGFIDDRQIFFFLLRAVDEENGAKNLPQVGCEVRLQLIGDARNANEQPMK